MTAKVLSRIVALSLASTALIAVAPASAATFIDFEKDTNGNNNAAGSQVNVTYQSLGLNFANAQFKRCAGGCPTPTNGLFISTNNFRGALTAMFNTVVSGFTFSNVTNSSGTATAFDALGNTLEVVNFANTGVATWGFAASGIKSIQFRSNSQFGVDNFSFTAAAGVPEPATWAFLILGFGLIGSAIRRRKPAVSTTVSYA